MGNRRLVIAGVALVATLGLTACGGATTTGTADKKTAAVATTPAADAAADLTAAAVKLTAQSAKVTMDMTGGVSMTGVTDPKAGSTEMTMKTGAEAGGATVLLRKIGTDMWMKFTGSMSQLGGFGNGKWMHVDTKALGAGSAFDTSSTDPATAAQMLKNAVTVERVGDHGFKGTIDMTKAQTAVSKAVTGLGDKAKAVPFTATTDNDGRLIQMTIDMSALSAEAGTMKMAYSDFGTPVSVTAPPKADVVELPAQLKGLMGGS
jgi:hypothetical protein